MEVGLLLGAVGDGDVEWEEVAGALDPRLYVEITAYFTVSRPPGAYIRQCYFCNVSASSLVHGYPARMEECMSSGTWVG
jgi:hypothetical protein